MGRLYAHRSGIRSTKKQRPPLPIASDEFPIPDVEIVLPSRPHIFHNCIYKVGAHLVEIFALKGTIAMDFCSRCPHTSNRGMKYIFILYNYDSNAILATPTKSRLAPNMIGAYNICYTQIIVAGISSTTKSPPSSLTPPSPQRISHISLRLPTTIASTQPNAPYEIPKTTLSQSSTAATMPSQHICGAASSLRRSSHSTCSRHHASARNALPTSNYLAFSTPLETKVIIHKHPKQCVIWAPHGNLGWLTGFVSNNYRHYTVTVNNPDVEHVSVTVTFLPTKYVLPNLSVTHRIELAPNDLATAITLVPLPTLPSQPARTTDALDKQQSISPITPPGGQNENSSPSANSLNTHNLQPLDQTLTNPDDCSKASATTLTEPIASKAPTPVFESTRPSSQKKHPHTHSSYYVKNEKRN